MPCSTGAAHICLPTGEASLGKLVWYLGWCLSARVSVSKNICPPQVLTMENIFFDNYNRGGFCLRACKTTSSFWMWPKALAAPCRRGPISEGFYRSQSLHIASLQVDTGCGLCFASVSRGTIRSHACLFWPGVLTRLMSQMMTV